MIGSMNAFGFFYATAMMIHTKERRLKKHGDMIVNLKVYSRLMNKQPKAQGPKRQRQEIARNFEYRLDRLDPLRSISRKDLLIHRVDFFRCCVAVVD